MDVILLDKRVVSRASFIRNKIAQGRRYNWGTLPLKRSDSLKKFFSTYGFLLAVAGIIVALDQLSKSIVRANLELHQVWVPWEWLRPYARIVHEQNTGAAFGILQDFGGVFTVLAIVVSIAIFYYFPQIPKSDWLLRLALGLQLGGALGNMIDRVRYDWVVTDFISVGTFAVLNIADASISIGVALLIIGIYLRERREEREKALAAQAAEASSQIEPTLNDNHPASESKALPEE
jgi:signal peptidase II